MNRGKAYDDKGDYDQSIGDQSKAIELPADLAGAYFNRGNAYGGKGDPAAAAADYDSGHRT